MSEHARLSPSASERWLACAASVSMTEAILESRESAAAAEGTRAHEVLEETLKTWIATGEFDVECDDEEMRENIALVATYVIAQFESIPDATMLIETRVDLHYMTGRADLWGKADIIIYNDQFINVLDLKYGQGIFVPADTSQNRIYILGVMSRLMKESRGDIPWEQVIGTIMQPRYADKDGKTNRFIMMPPEELIKWKDEVLVPGAEATDNPGGPIAGKKQCTFCLAKPNCPAVQQKVADLCSVFQPVDATGTVLINNLPVEKPEPDTMDIDKLIEVHDQIPFIEGYLKAVSKKIRDLLEARDNRLVGKLKLVRSRQTNKWGIDDDKLLEVLTVGAGKIPKNQLTKQVVISAPQALKLKSLKPAQKARMQELITKSEGSLSIVPWTDGRSNEFPELPFEAAPEGGSDEGYDFL